MKPKITIPEKVMSLYVEGRGFGGGIIFFKHQGQWYRYWCPPYLAKVLGNTPVDKTGEVLTKKGFTWQWIPDKPKKT